MLAHESTQLTRTVAQLKDLYFFLKQLLILKNCITALLWHFYKISKNPLRKLIWMQKFNEFHLPHSLLDSATVITLLYILEISTIKFTIFFGKKLGFDGKMILPPRKPELLLELTTNPSTVFVTTE